jgi:hypothetical protein
VKLKDAIRQAEDAIVLAVNTGEMEITDADATVSFAAEVAAYLLEREESRVEKLCPWSFAVAMAVDGAHRRLVEGDA